MSCIRFNTSCIRRKSKFKCLALSLFIYTCIYSSIIKNHITFIPSPSFKCQLVWKAENMVMGLIQGLLLRGDGRMVTQMVSAYFTFKFWSQMLRCVSLEVIFRKIEIENVETDTFFSLLLTCFSTSDGKPGMHICSEEGTKACLCCYFTTDSTYYSPGTPSMGGFHLYWESSRTLELPGYLSKQFNLQVPVSHVCFVIWSSFIIISTFVFWNGWFSMVSWVIQLSLPKLPINLSVSVSLLCVLVTLLPSENALTPTPG